MGTGFDDLKWDAHPFPLNVFQALHHKINKSRSQKCCFYFLPIPIVNAQGSERECLLNGDLHSSMHLSESSYFLK